MSRALFMLVMFMVLLTAVVVGIDLIGRKMEERIHGQRQQPIMTLNDQHGEQYQVYDLDVDGRSCLLIQHDDSGSLSCDWSGL